MLPAQNRDQLLPIPGKVDVTVTGAEESVWRLDVPPEQAVRVFIREHQGIAGIVTVEDAKGSAIVRVDCTIRLPQAKHVTLLPGSYRISVRPYYHTPGERKFEIETSQPTPATDADRQSAAAEQLEGEGERIYRLYQAGYLPAAREKYEAAVALLEKLGDRARLADVLPHLAGILYEQGQMPAAIDLFQRELELWKGLNDDGGIAAALYGLGLVTGDIGQPQRAMDYLNQSLDLRRALNDRLGQMETLIVRGTVNLTLGKSELALADLEEGLKLAQEIGERAREIDAQSMLAGYDYRTGNFQDAIRRWGLALAIANEEGQRARAAGALSNIGVGYLNSGDPRESIHYLEEALPLRKALAFPGSYANTLYNLAMAHLDLGEYQKALDGLNEALPIFRKELHRVGEAYTLQGLAMVSIEMGRDTQALGFLRQSLEIRRKASDRRGEAESLLRLGAVDGRLGNDSKAIEEEREALSIAQASGYQPEQAQSLAALGEALIRSGDAAGALDPLQQAVALSRKIGVKLAESNALNLEGRALIRLGRVDSAREAFAQALELRHSAGAPSSEAQTLFELAGLEREAGPRADASRHALAAVDLVESLRENFGGRQSRLEMASSHRKYYDLAIQIAMDAEDPRQAFEIAERARARGFLDLLAEARVDVRRGVDPVLLTRLRQTEELLDAKHDRFLRMLDSPHTAAREASARKDIDELVDRYAETERQIRAASPEYAGLTQAHRLSLSATQALLPEQGTALVEFWLGEQRSFVWVVSKTGCRGFALPPRAAIEAAARRVYQALNTRNPGVADLQHSTAELSAMLAPALEAAAGARQWWIVADGALEYVPFAALPNLRSSAPLAVRHEIVELPSASALAEVRQETDGRRPAPEEVAVFADPVFRADDERVSGAPAAAPAQADETFTRAVEESGLGSLPRLHFSREEARTIARLAPARQRWIALDFDASRAAVEKPDLGLYRIVHFATHGLIDSRHPELSGIVFSMVDRAGRPQDGFLRLHEIYNLKLNADLVVLSACQTALGESVRSEGMIGLTRGFMYAGAPQVLASLWSVQDRAAAEFMRRFYDALLRRGLAAPAALQSAQLSMLNDSRWSSPYYWSAFVLQGAK
jgi:CHAT domain-containing protein/Flp pilus assembly protein TadD